jgi:GPH family glycoside/pentoside/hexuronide:cation symporter
MAVCYYLLLSPPPLLGAGLFAWFIGFYFLMLTSRKFYETAYGALMPELTLDYDERTKLSTFRQLLGTVGDISGALLPFAASYLFARGTDFKVTGAVCGLVVAGGAMLAYAGLRERTEFSTRERSRLFASLKSVAGNRPFVILLIATTLAVMAINIPTVLMRFLAKYWYHDENAAARWLMAYFAGSAVSYPFWFRITVRIEKKPAFVVAMICNAIGSLLLMLLTRQSTLALYFLMAFSGFSAIGIWVTQISASADVIEWDQERTGQRQEGAYGGITSMSIKMAIAVSLLLVGPVLSWVGYKPGVGGITEQAGENLRTLFALGPASLYLLSALVFSRYPITRESHRAMRDRLAARNAAAEEEEKAKSIA